MKRTNFVTGATRLVVVLTLSALPAVRSSAQMNEPLHTDGWILAAARAPGLQDSIWRTDLWIYADTHSTATVNLFFCRSNTDNSAVTPFAVAVSGGKKLYYLEDVVEQYLHVGGGSWVGAIHYTANVPVQVWARVYSISPDGKKSYGQLIAGIATADMSPDTDPWNPLDTHNIYAAKHTADGRFRVNVGVVNPTAVPTDFTVLIWNEKGQAPVGGTRMHDVTVPPFSMVQLTDPFAGIEGGSWSDFTIQTKVETEGGGGFAYASVVDNATNDAYFVRGVKGYTVFEHAGQNCTAHEDGWILAAARAPGLQQSIWRTDLWVRTRSSYGHTVNLTFCRSGADNTAAVPIELSTPDGEGVFYVEDVVEQFLHVGETPWLGAIHYTANQEVQVWARVYSISPDGTKSYGQLVEGISSADSSPSWHDVSGVRDMQYVYAMKHTADGRFRVNVGVVNPSALACDYRVAIFDSHVNNPGTGSFEPTVTVPPYSMVQLTDPYAAVDGGEWHDYMLQLLCDTSEGKGFLYASVVDNATNDAFFVRGIKRRP